MEFIDSYKDMFGTRRFTSRTRLTPGTIVQFTYDNEQKYAVVLNSEWQGKMHALSLRNLTPDTLKKLLGELNKETNADVLYEKYKMSEYTDSRPYRTYTINKISALREIFLKSNTED